MLNSRDFLAAVFTDLGPFFDGFSAKRAFAGKEPLMDFFNGLIDLLLYEIIAELEVCDGFDGLRFANVTDHFGRL